MTLVAPPVAPEREEWERLAATWTAPRDVVVDVLVPVYRGFDETLRCLFSVLRAPQATPYRLVVVDDCGPDEKLREELAWLESRGLIELHRTPQNLGFVGACNLGMALHPDRDVVLLNSDTEVFNDWLDRLRQAALRDPKTATVTPFSNNAEICSYPHFVKDNMHRLEIGDAELDLLAARANAGREVDLPTGVGFCMYIRRFCLDAIGLFDIATFGRGYGEENDLCRRAAAKGWRNILAADVFVRHYGAVSFGASKSARMEEASRRLARKHPDYFDIVDAFVRQDPIHWCRQALDFARIEPRTRKGAMLFVTHDWGGGTERHVQDLSALLEASGVPVFFCRVDAENRDFARITDPYTPETPNLPAIEIGRDVGGFAELLRQLGVVHMHIHHFAGFPELSPDFFRVAAAEAGIRYDVTLHDYIAFCPRINLIDRTGVYCGEPDLASCERCIDREGSPVGRPSVWQWRDRYHRLLLGARRVFAPSRDVARRIGRHLPGVACVVQPHPEGADSSPSAISPLRLPPKEDSRRRVVLVGAIGPHKGSEILADTARAALRLDLPLEFVVLGYTDRDEEMAEIGNVFITGPYQESELAQRLVEVGGDLVWFSSVCPETYSYTLSAALKVGTNVVAFDLGAIAERIRDAQRGTLLPLELMLDPGALAERLASLPLSRRAPVPSLACEGRRYPVPTLSYYGIDSWPPATTSGQASTTRATATAR